MYNFLEVCLIRYCFAVKNLKAYRWEGFWIKLLKGIVSSLSKANWFQFRALRVPGKSVTTILNMIGLNEYALSGGAHISNRKYFPQNTGFWHLTANKKLKFPTNWIQKMTVLTYEYLGFIFQSF